MKPTILAIRAIGAEFARRTFRIVLIIASIITALSLALTFWLIQQSSWWLLLLFVLTSAICIAIGVLTVFFLTIRRVTPAQNTTQKQAVKRFVDSLQKMSEIAGTPKFMLLFQLMKDVAAPREHGFIGSTIDTSKSLRDDFRTLIHHFS